MEKDGLSKLREGDAEAFRELVDAYRDKVCGTCFRFLRNREDAEETALDVFLEIHRSLPSFREEAELSTWMFRIAVTKSLDRLRKRKRLKRFDGLLGRRTSSADWETMAAPADSGPEQSLEIAERSRILREAINRLPENQKAAITLSRYEGLENEKIAEILGSTASAIEALLHRAKRNLKKKLWRYYKNVIDGESYDEAQD
jgi:RNA polymerase sigma-70 factor (ECF subfamily)